MKNYPKSKSRLVLLLAIAGYLIYNIIEPATEYSDIFSLALLPIAILSIKNWKEIQ